jgi:N-acetyl-S-(2-succino)cysteine monooxygenase
MSDNRSLVLVLQILGLGTNSQAWRLPDSPAERLYDLDLYSEIAQAAEAAKIHSLFLSDGVGTGLERPNGHFEPFTFQTALAARTSRIGVVVTASTTFNAPFNLARITASLDHLSKGRAGWNIVTSSAGERNFGTDPLPPHDERYARAEEYVSAVKALWESWDADARVIDREAGVFVDPGKVRRTNFVSEHYSVEGPLNVDRSPQGVPFLFQAGSSTAGVDFGARHADAIFTSQPDLDEGVRFYKNYKERVAAAGRNPDDVKILPGLYTVIELTEAQARETAGRLAELAAGADWNVMRKNFESTGFGGVDLSDLDPDRPIPLDRLPAVEDVQGRRSRYELYRRWVLAGDRTLRQLVEHNNAAASGHWDPVGSVEQIADEIQDRFEARALDGVVISPQHFGGYRVITDHLVPELQRRGLFQAEYAGDTLRYNVLGHH